MHKKDPHNGHHQLLDELRGTCGRYGLAGITDVEQIAILAQLIGAKVHDLDERQFDVGEIMQAISRNIASGNAGAAGEQLIGIGKPT